MGAANCSRMNSSSESCDNSTQDQGTVMPRKAKRGGNGNGNDKGKRRGKHGLARSRPARPGKRERAAIRAKDAERKASCESEQNRCIDASRQSDGECPHRDNREIRETLLSISPAGERPRCFWCNATLTLRLNLTVDHVVARSAGGSHHVDNAVLSCMRCQIAKAKWESAVDQEARLVAARARRESGDKSAKLAASIKKMEQSMERNKPDVENAKRKLTACYDRFTEVRGKPPRMRRE
jgi:5-methylcytosine-specific restriction endonuclease McrA